MKGDVRGVQERGKRRKEREAVESLFIEVLEKRLTRRSYWTKSNGKRKVLEERVTE